MRRIGWCLVAILLSLFTMTQAVSAGGKPKGGSVTQGASTTTSEQKNEQKNDGSKAANSEGQQETRGDPKTTYDQAENATHSGKVSGSAEAVSTSSQISASSSSDPAGHWLVRQVKTSTSGRWTLYDTGEVKRAGGL